MSQSLFRKLRGNSSEGAAGAAAAAGVSRRSSGFQELAKHLRGTEALTVLDLGAASASNISHITSLGHKVYNEDLLMASADPALVRQAEDGGSALDVERFFAENLVFKGEQFDAVLCWDIADYLQEVLVQPMIERLHSVMKPGGVLLGFFHTRDAGPEAPCYRYHIGNGEDLLMRPVPRFKMQRVFNNRHIEKLFHDFKSLKFFLARDYIREVLVVR